MYKTQCAIDLCIILIVRLDIILVYYPLYLLCTNKDCYYYYKMFFHNVI